MGDGRRERRGRVGRRRGGCRTRGWRRRRSGEAPPLDACVSVLPCVEAENPTNAAPLTCSSWSSDADNTGLGGRVGHGHLQDAAFPVIGTRGTVVDPGVDGRLAGEVDAAGGVVPEVGGRGGDHGAEIGAHVVPVGVAELDRGGVGGSGRRCAALRTPATPPSMHARNAARAAGASSRGNSALLA